MAENTLRPYGWRGSRISLDQRPVKDEVETSHDGTFASDAEVPDEDGPMVTAALESKHRDASGSTEHHRNMETPRRSTRSEYERTGKRQQYPSDAHYSEWLRETGKDPRGSDWDRDDFEMYRSLFGRRHRNDPDSPVVTAAREVKHVDAHGSVEHHYPGSRERTGAQAGEDNEFGQEQPRWEGARRSPSFKRPQDPTNPEYESIGGDLAGEEAENTAEDRRAGSLRGRNRRPFMSEPGPWGAKQPSASRRVEAHPVFDRSMDKDSQKPSGARPGQPAEHLHVQRPSQARKALDLALGVVRKFTAGADRKSVV